MSNKPEVLFDKRIVARQIKRGKVTKKDYEQHLSTLPDISSKGVPLSGEPPRGEGR